MKQCYKIQHLYLVFWLGYQLKHFFGSGERVHYIPIPCIPCTFLLHTLYKFEHEFFTCCACSLYLLCLLVHTPSNQYVCTIFLLLYFKYSNFFFRYEKCAQSIYTKVQLSNMPHARPMHSICTPNALPLHAPCTFFARAMHTLCSHVPIYLNSIST